MIVGTLHQSRLRINISQSHVDSHRRIEVGENLASYCLYNSKLVPLINKSIIIIT